jgi:hypothetical protein
LEGLCPARLIEGHGGEPVGDPPTRPSWGHPHTCPGIPGGEPEGVRGGRHTPSQGRCSLRTAVRAPAASPPLPIALPQPSNVAPEMFRAITLTVLFDQTAASISMNRVDDTSDACARSPARAPFTVTSSSDVAPGARLGRSQDTSVANSRRPERNSAPANSGVPFRTAGAASGSPQNRRDCRSIGPSKPMILLRIGHGSAER